MTDITELAQSLKALANNAGADYWQAKKIGGDFYVIRKGSYKRECGYTTYQPIAEIDHKPTRDYVAMANPTNILALVEALEKSQGMEAYWKTQCRGITDHCEELQARIAELESRTVKLPPKIERDYVDGWFSYKGGLVGGGAAEWYNKALDDVRTELTATGIKVEAE
ncbi:TPA: ead/Ea22-like family protein [Klebsiella pneumoniae]